MKRLIAYAVVAMCGIHASAHAQWAVLDVANLQQAMQEVQAWQKQYRQMEEQRDQLKQQLNAATGSRGLGSIANNPLLQATVPADLTQYYSSLQANGAQGLTAAARAIRGQSKIYDCENRTGADLIACQRLLNNAAQQQALLHNAFAMSALRKEQIQALQDRISTTSDPKSIAELQARLQVETTQVSNDANRLALLRSLGDAAAQAAEQALREIEQHSLSLHNDGSASFRFVPATQR